MNTQNKGIKAQAVIRTKVETTYEYITILGGIIGFWRKMHVDRVGDDIEIHLQAQIGEYDRLLINGKEVKVTNT